MVGLRIVVLLMISAFFLASCAQPALDPSPGKFTISPAMRPFKWTAQFRGFKPAYENESGRQWEIDYQLLVDFSDYEKKYGKFTEIIPAISGVWRYNASGCYQAGPSTYAVSSRFSTTGIPIERFDGWPTLRLLHGKGGSPFEAVDEKPLPDAKELTGKLLFEGSLRVALPDDAPNGYYEPCFYVLVRVEGSSIPCT